MISIYVNCSVFCVLNIKNSKEKCLLDLLIYYETNRYNRHFNYIIKL